MTPVKITAVLAVCFLLSSFIVTLINLPHDGIGGELRKTWEDIRGGLAIEAPTAIFEGILSLGLFLFVISMTAMDMRYRHFLAVLAVSLVAFMGVTPPQKLVENVDWALIVFLVGSMSFATILRKLGVFTYLAAHLVRLSRGNPFLLVSLLSLLAWFTAMVVDEVTSIVYVVMIVLELGRLMKVDVEDLVLLTVLATNTGSLALPVGNPIGVYVAFTAGFTASDFLRHALPLSLLCFVTTLFAFISLRGSFMRKLKSAIVARHGMLDAFITTKIVDVTQKERVARVYGVVLLVLFLFTVSASPIIAQALSHLSGTSVDPNSLLALVPCLFVVLTLPVAEVPEFGEIIAKGVEWPSITFFMFLFMLGYSLTWSGAMVRVAYVTVTLSQLLGPGPEPLFIIMMLTSAFLSAFLDNLSLVVAMVPAIRLIVDVTGFRELFWSVLFGGVLGGNLTPIGSTANIVAVSILERRRRGKVSWSKWLMTSLPVFVIHCLIASIWRLMAF